MVLLVRADANVHIGSGHVMRCLAVAQAWQDAGGEAMFVCSELPSSLQRRLASSNIAVRSLHAAPGSHEDARETAAIAAELIADWLLVDGFHFDESFLEILHTECTPMILMDDHAARATYRAEIVLNPNIFAAQGMYRQASSATILAGCDYALLRREFRERTSLRPRSAEGNRVLVTMGGSDPNNVSVRVMAALDQIKTPLDITVLSGGCNPHLALLQDAVLASRHSAQLLTDIADMPALLSSVDMAISAPGGTCFELAVMGVPMMLVTIAANHQRTAQEFAARGLATSVGWYDQLTVSEFAGFTEEFVKNGASRRTMAARALGLIDGRGALRVISAMLARQVKAAI